MKHTLSFISGSLLCLFLAAVLSAQTSDWTSESVDWRLAEQSRIKAIRYPVRQRPRLSQLDPAPPASSDSLSTLDLSSTTLVNDITIDSPPIAGFTPWVVFTATNKRKADLETDAEPTNVIQGSYMIAEPWNTYGVGLLDTGAAAHVINAENANRLGIAGNFLTDNTMEVEGVTGSVSMWVSQPLALYAAGFHALEPNGVLHLSEMRGQYNVSLGVGDSSAANLPTALGIPLMVYYTIVFYNDTYLTLNRYEQTFITPDIRILNAADDQIPQYDISVPLELRPLGAQSVQYTPEYDSIIGFDDVPPQTPSIIVGLGSQSLYFVHSVDLYDGSRSAMDRDRFMLDTGAQVSVIGRRVGARLGLDPEQPDFEVDIEGVNGEIAIMGGFYLDRLEIPALGQWLIFTNVPVVLLDVASPEGGTLDGIIGMNLFNEYNMVLRNGGMMLQDDPALELQYIATSGLLGDIAPLGGDGVVDTRDLSALASAWLDTAQAAAWNPAYDLAPPAPDGMINLNDYVVLAAQWLNAIPGN